MSRNFQTHIWANENSQIWGLKLDTPKIGWSVFKNYKKKWSQGLKIWPRPIWKKKQFVGWIPVSKPLFVELYWWTDPWFDQSCFPFQDRVTNQQVPWRLTSTPEQQGLPKGSVTDLSRPGLLASSHIHGSPVVQQGAHCLQLPDLAAKIKGWLTLVEYFLNLRYPKTNGTSRSQGVPYSNDKDWMILGSPIPGNPITVKVYWVTKMTRKQEQPFSWRFNP